MAVTAAQDRERARREGVDVAAPPPPPPTPAELLEGGAMQASLDAAARHSGTAAVLAASLGVVGELCAAEPMAAAVAGSSGGGAVLQAALGFASLKGASSPAEAAEVRAAACRTALALGVAQALLQRVGGEGHDPVARAQQLGTGLIAAAAASAPKAGGAGGERARQHARAALSWLSLDASGWSSLIGSLSTPEEREEAAGALHAPLAASLSPLAAPALIGLLRRYHSHDRLAEGCCDALRVAFTTAALSAAEVAASGLVPLLLDLLRSGASRGASRLSAAVALLASFASEEDLLTSLLEGGALRLLVPLMHESMEGGRGETEQALAFSSSSSSLPSSSLPSSSSSARLLEHGCALLSLALRRRLTERRLRERRGGAEGRPCSGDGEAELLEAALPVMLHVLGGDREEERAALGHVFAALRSIAATAEGASALLRAGVLPRSLCLCRAWPEGAARRAAVDLMAVLTVLMRAAGCPTPELLERRAARASGGGGEGGGGGGGCRCCGSAGGCSGGCSGIGGGGIGSGDGGRGSRSEGRGRGSACGGTRGEGTPRCEEGRHMS